MLRVRPGTAPPAQRGRIDEKWRKLEMATVASATSYGISADIDAGSILEICAAIGASLLRSMDCPFARTPGLADRVKNKAPWPDAEWKALDFLPAMHPARVAWPEFWPTTGNTLNWDAVGIATVGETEEYVLIEAKAHTEELKSDCTAKEHGGLPKIRAAFDTVRQYLGVVQAEDWLKTYYQYCNRLAALAFLGQKGVPARLIMIYFTGDRWPDDKHTSPANVDDWKQPLATRAAWVGLPSHHHLKHRICEVYLPIIGPAASSSS